jgi:hypothetical protein
VWGAESDIHPKLAGGLLIPRRLIWGIGQMKSEVDVKSFSQVSFE